MENQIGMWIFYAWAGVALLSIPTFLYTSVYTKLSGMAVLGLCAAIIGWPATLMYLVIAAITNLVEWACLTSFTYLRSLKQVRK